MTASTLAENFKSRLLSWLRSARSWTAARIVVAILLIAIAVSSIQAAFSLVLAPGHLVTAIGIVVGVHFAYTFYVRWMEQRRAAELDWHLAPVGLAGGIGLGTLLLCATVAVLAGLGAYEMGSYLGFGGFSMAIAAALVAGYVEEVLFRGVLFRLIEDVAGSWLSLLFSAVLFGLMHAGNPGADLWTTVAISLEAGILLGSAFVLTRNLWFPVGIHIAWNLVQGGVLGFGVSGFVYGGLFEQTVTGPRWLSGGSFGPEASVIAVALCTAVSVVFLARARQKGRLVKPRWRRWRAPA